MNRACAFLVCLVFSCGTNAGCFGTQSFYTCNDNSGNSYNVNKFGNNTNVNGYNSATGSQWNEHSTTMGNLTQINGTAANGRHWNETINNFGNGMRTINGVDSNGNSFSTFCGPGGCK